MIEMYNILYILYYAIIIKKIKMEQALLFSNTRVNAYPVTILFFLSLLVIQYRCIHDNNFMPILRIIIVISLC